MRTNENKNENSTRMEKRKTAASRLLVSLQSEKKGRVCVLSLHFFANTRKTLKNDNSTLQTLRTKRATGGVRHALFAAAAAHSPLPPLFLVFFLSFLSSQRRRDVDHLDRAVESRQIQLRAHLHDARDLGDDGAVGVLEPAIFFCFEGGRERGKKREKED